MKSRLSAKGLGRAFGALGAWRSDFIAKVGICSILSVELWLIFYELQFWVRSCDFGN